MRNHIEEAWKQFELRTITPAAGEAQRREMRGAFYAGALVLFTTMIAKVSDDGEITEADMGLMEDIERELREFCAAARRAANEYIAKRSAEGGA